MGDNLIVKADGVGKKFCRSLKKSLWYGLKDIAGDINPLRRRNLDGSATVGNNGLRPDEFWAVKDVSFGLRKGECLGLIGHNGAGKTTLLKMLNGLIKPDRGRIEMRGRVGALIALGAGFNPVLSGRENIYVNAAVLGMTRRETDRKLEAIIDFAEIREFIDAPVQGYSSGMAIRLGFAIAAHCQTDILLLDEVLAVGDMGFRAKCFNKLGEFREAGNGFILVSHDMMQITRFCGRVLYLKRGTVASHGSATDGVATFIKDMMAGSTAGKDASAPTIEEAGSFALRVEDAFFATPSAPRTTEIKTGEAIKLVLRYRCEKGPIGNPVLELNLRDPGGEVLFHGSSRMAGVELGELTAAGTLEISFPWMPANNQKLTASVAIWDSEMRGLLYWRRGDQITVLGHPHSVGRILIDCGWTHTPGHGARPTTR
jgi:ABC-type polysaccharide/polyol phosphate transport system ATPase subunit